MSKQIKKFTADGPALLLNDNQTIQLKNNPSPLDRHNGFTLNIISMTGDAPHNGEMHPDGDEVLYLMSGNLEITLELEQQQLVYLNAGEGLVIPKGVWHKVHVVAAAKIMSLSPGPGFEYRALTT